MWPSWATNPMLHLAHSWGQILAPGQGLANASKSLAHWLKAGKGSVPILVPHGSAYPQLSRYQEQLVQGSESVPAVHPRASVSKAPHGCMKLSCSDLTLAFRKPGQEFDQVGHLDTLWFTRFLHFNTVSI